MIKIYALLVTSIFFNLGFAFNTSMSEEEISMHEEKIIKEMQEYKASDIDILRKYHQVGKELFFKKEYTLARFIMERGLKRFKSRSNEVLIFHHFVCETYAREKNLPKLKNCTKKHLNDKTLNFDLEIYINFLYMYVHAVNKPYLRVINTDQRRIISQNGLQPSFEILDFSHYFRTKKYKKAYETIVRFENLLEENEFAILHDFLVFKLGNNQPKKCMPLYQVYLKTFDQPEEVANTSNSYKICKELSKKEPSNVLLLELVKHLENDNLEILKDVIQSVNSIK